jgi:hypothetical protein
MNKSNKQTINQFHFLAIFLLPPGKTWTMMGNRGTEVQHGIIPRLVASVFNAIGKADDHVRD